MRKRTLLSWSSGKDSAWTLWQLQQDPTIELVALWTSINQEADRVAMHAVRRELVEAQAAAAGLPLWTSPLPWPCCNQQYEVVLQVLWQRAHSAGLEQVAYGDLFLEDIRRYREQQMHGTGLTPIFPLWGLPTDQLVRDMIAGGLSATLTCIDPGKLPRSFAGRRFDSNFLQDLPSGIDPCGENGEFHTFADQGPMFRHAIRTKPGVVIERDGFVFTDLLNAAEQAA